MSTPYVIRRNGMYYGHNSCGYVSSVYLAELYTEEYAKRHARITEECTAIPVTDLVPDRDQPQEYLDRIEAILNAIPAP